MTMRRPSSPRWLLALGCLLAPAALAAQRESTPRSDSLRAAQRLDRDGAFAESRAIYRRLLASATDEAARAAVQRRLAMSYAFEGNCPNVVEYEQLVIQYWQTREAAEPQNAFYQEGEMADEAARVCLDIGEIDIAETLYRRGYELGLREPEPRTHPQSLWDYRLAHAMGRIAARRGDRAEADRHVARARAILDADSAMARQQERFFPYLAGYVALYTGHLEAAERELTRALAIEANQRDPFMHCLLAMTLDKLGRGEAAQALYRKAYDLATAHNPPAAFARRFARQQLAGS